MSKRNRVRITLGRPSSVIEVEKLSKEEVLKTIESIMKIQPHYYALKAAIEKLKIYP